MTHHFQTLSHTASAFYQKPVFPAPLPRDPVPHPAPGALCLGSDLHTALPLYCVADIASSRYFAFYLSVLPLVKFCTTNWNLEVDPTIKNQEFPKLSQ